MPCPTKSTLAQVLVFTAVTSLAAFDVAARDRDDNPPGPRGGPGTNWENPRGPVGGPGASPNRRWRDRDDNPPGPRGGPGTNWENPPGPKGGIGASPDVRHRHYVWLQGRLGPADWAVFVTLSVADRYAFCGKRKIHRDHCWYDRDDNPPGPAGGPGTNWENPPGPVGGPGAGPDDRRRHHGWLQGRMSPADWAVFVTLSAADRHVFCSKRRIHRDHCWYDPDDNPPGPAGGPGTNWENPPGPVGGPGASPDRR